MGIDKYIQDIPAKEKWKLDKQGMFSASLIYVLLNSTPTSAELKNDSTLKFGKGAMSYIKKVATQSVGKVDDNDFGGGIYHLENGIRLEGISLNNFRKQFFPKEKYKDLNMVHYGESNQKFFKYNAYSGCSPDCVFYVGDLAAFVVEAKCPTSETQMDTIIQLHKLAKQVMRIEGIEDYNEARQKALKEWNYQYYCQIQFQLMTFNVKNGYWTSYNEDMKDIRAKMIVLPIKQDPEIQTRIQLKLIEANAVKNSIVSDFNNALDLK